MSSPHADETEEHLARPGLRSSSSWDETRDLTRASPGLEEVAREGRRLEALETFGPYAIRGVLGRGGMGAVFEVEHRELGVRYALKTILASPDQEGYERQLERFRREATLHARLDHPHVLRVHSALLDPRPGQPAYLVVDLLRGGSLADRIDAGERLSIEEGTRLARALASALRHAHAQGVLHRDLKPDNVMLDEAGVPRLVDFGLARDVNRETRLTKSGTIVGTPLTLAPEQIVGGDATPASDVYGLAVTVFWALAGEAPLGEECVNLGELLVAIREASPKSLEALRPEVPRELARLLEQSLAKAPEDRPTLADWERVLSGEAPARSPAPLAVGVVLGVAALLAGGYALRARSPAPSRPPIRPGSPGPISKLAVPESAAAWLARVEPLRADEVESAARVLAHQPLAPAQLERVEARLGGLASEPRAALWALACVQSGEATRAREHARRGTTARLLVEQELRRAKVDREVVIPRFTVAFADRKVAERELEELNRTARSWPRLRVAALPAPERALAEVVLDRHYWTIGRLAFVSEAAMRALSSGGGVRYEATSLLETGPPTTGPGSLILELYRCYGSANLPRAEVYAHATEFREEMRADPGARILFGSIAASQAEPAEALREGAYACASAAELGPLVSHVDRMIPSLAVRLIEAEWLGLPREPETTRPILAFLLELTQLDRHRNKRHEIPQTAWALFRRDLEAADQILNESEARARSEAAVHHPKLLLLRCELLLAVSPVDNASLVLERAGEEASYLEFHGLRAHARSLLGQDPSADLAAWRRAKAAGLRRLGLPWHAYHLEQVLEGTRWWPGRPRSPEEEAGLRALLALGK